MKLFKNKDKTKLKDKIGTKIFGDIWNNDKEKSIVLLIFWLMFISLVSLLVSNSNNNNYKEIEYKNPKELISNLKEYNYDLTISNNDNIVYYTGRVFNNIDVGIKEFNDTKINYRIVDDTTYDNITLDIIDYPYDELSLKIINYLDNYIEDYIENDIKVYKYKVLYNNEEILVYLKVINDRISSIEYNYQNNKYNINYY